MSYAALRVFAKKPILRFKSDCLISFFAIPAGRVGVALARRLQLPSLVALRGSDTPGFARKPLPTGMLRILTRKPLQRADVLVANGQHLAELGTLASGRTVRRLDNGVDTASFRPPDSIPTIKLRPLRILSVLRLVEGKGVAELAATVRWLEKMKVQADISIVGTGSLSSYLAKSSRTENDYAHIEQLGHIPRDLMPDVYRDHDVLLHLSPAEGISNVVLEALASGLPVVGTRAAAGELSDGDQEGPLRLVHSTNPSVVGELLKAYKNDPELLVHDRAAARAVAERWSWDATVENAIQLFSTAIQQHALWWNSQSS